MREDLNRHNFVVVDGGRVHVIDFENAMNYEDDNANAEMDSGQTYPGGGGGV